MRNPLTIRILAAYACIVTCCTEPLIIIDGAECFDADPGAPKCPTGYACSDDNVCEKHCWEDAQCLGEFGANLCATCIAGTCKATDCYVPTCGNDIVDDAVGEACDDGNTVDDDYCSADCRIVTGACGDDTIQLNEVCDDGNAVRGDYCQYDCRAITGFCGDRGRQTNEICDDGNTIDGDYCRQDCQLVTGRCGDGAIQNNESCDDGLEPMDGDGCSDACQVEFGYECPGAAAVCTSSCGDGKKTAAEACDDGDIEDGDGCSSECELEVGFDCAGVEPSECTFDCGDGLIVAGESCDDGDRDHTNWCNNDCQPQLVCEPDEPCWPLLNTEATTCYSKLQPMSYCPGVAGGDDCAETAHCGQDAQYSVGLRVDFELQGSGEETTVYDSRTGIWWQRHWVALHSPGENVCVGGNCEYSAAENYCEWLEYGGYDDWYIPSQPELQTLVDYERYDPAIDVLYFPDLGSSTAQIEYLWSSTPSPEQSQGANQHFLDSWGIDLAAGLTVARLDHTTGTPHVICARSEPRTIVDPPNAERFSESGDSEQPTFHDRRTGLSWTQLYGDYSSWTVALRVCEELSYAGEDDWRLPNIRTLHGLVSYRHEDRRSATAHPGSAYARFWTSTSITEAAEQEATPSPAQGWMIDFRLGSTELSAKTERAFVRCVRGTPHSL